MTEAAIPGVVGSGTTAVAAVGAGAPAERANGAEREPLVGITDLVKYYPIHGGVMRRHVGDVRAVDGVTFDVKAGEILGLVGESGCGKSTLGKTLLQLLPATSGSVTLRGESVLDKKGNDLKRLRRKMQIVFQDPVSSLNPRMPVSDIIGEGLIAQADKENHWGDATVREKRVGDYLETVGLRRDYARRFPHEFSGGQRQRIGIARALVLEPDFIVCDEPVSALDVSIQSQILNLLLDLRRDFGLTYLFVAHNLSVVQYLSDRVGVMYLQARRAGPGRPDLLGAQAPLHGRAAIGRSGAGSTAQVEAPGAQGGRAIARRSALGLPVPHPLLASGTVG